MSKYVLVVCVLVVCSSLFIILFYFYFSLYNLSAFVANKDIYKNAT